MILCLQRGQYLLTHLKFVCLDKSWIELFSDFLSDEKRSSSLHHIVKRFVYETLLNCSRLFDMTFSDKILRICWSFQKLICHFLIGNLYSNMKLEFCNLNIFKLLQGGDLRYCKKCSLYKPPRAHHCRVCNRCVLRMVCMVYLLFMPLSNVLDSALNCCLLNLRITIAFGWIIVWAMQTTRCSSSLLSMPLFHAYIHWYVFFSCQLSWLLALIILSSTHASSILLFGAAASHKCEFSLMLEEIYFGALYNNLKSIKFCILLFQVLFIGSFTAGSSEDDQQDKSSFRTIFVSFLHIQFTMNYYFSNQIIQYKELHNQVISILLLLPLCGVLTFLLLWHIYLILQNKTTIEVCASDVIVISRFVATFLGCWPPPMSYFW